MLSVHLITVQKNNVKKKLPLTEYNNNIKIYLKITNMFKVINPESLRPCHLPITTSWLYFSYSNHGHLVEDWWGYHNYEQSGVGRRGWYESKKSRLCFIKGASLSKRFSSSHCVNLMEEYLKVFTKCFENMAKSGMQD